MNDASCRHLRFSNRQRLHGASMIGRNVVPLPPALDGGGIAMTKPASCWADPATGGDEGAIVNHAPHVRSTRTHVNVESGSGTRDKVYVSNETIGQRLDALRKRADVTIRELALGAGYRTGSGVQRYLEAGYAKALPLEVARRLVEPLVGRGSPPVQEGEVMALTGFIPEPNAIPIRMEGASAERMRDDLPIYGSALGAERQIDGEAVEQTTLNRAEILHYAKRPVLLNGNARAYGLYVSGSSMEPRYADGEIVVVDPKGRIKSGDDIVLYLRPRGEDDDGETARAALIKRFRRRTASFYELEQFTPAIAFMIPAADVVEVHRVIPWSEMLS